MSHPEFWMRGEKEGGWASQRELKAALNLENGIAAWRYRFPVLWHQERSRSWTRALESGASKERRKA